MGRHPWLMVASCGALAFAVLNVLAYRHAWAMTHFTPGAARPPSPGTMTWTEKTRVLLGGFDVPRPTNGMDPGCLGLPFEVERIAVPEGELEAWHIPSQHPRGIVLLFHGYCASKATLLGEAQLFHERGFDGLLVDFRGAGGSSGCETTVGVREADDVAAVCAYAADRWKARPVVVYGMSMGSAAALRAVARQGVRPRAMILECPFDRLTHTVGHRFSAMGLPAWPGAQLLVFWGGMQCGFDGFAHNPAEYAREVNCPVLLLHGERDTMVTRAEADAIYQALPGEKRVVLFPSAAHEACLAADPERWKQAVGRFLDGVFP
jgi:alpha-beta hydrolase superfamily lysophospholipase